MECQILLKFGSLVPYDSTEAVQRLKSTHIEIQDGGRPVLKVVCKRWMGSVVDGRSSNQRLRGKWPGDGVSLILPIKMVHFGVLFIPFCTVN